jgi:hypothetical protein
MNISINYSFSLEVLIIIGILYLIILINTVCSCCNVPKIIEKMKRLNDDDNDHS